MSMQQRHFAIRRAALLLAFVADVCIAAVGCSAGRSLATTFTPPERVAVCARAGDGAWCSRWQGDGFLPAARWSLDFGFVGAATGSGDALYSPDLDGDGRSDLCLRRADGLACALRASTDAFAATVQSPTFSDEDGFADWSTASTLAFVDVDGDGRVDACARRAAELYCAHGRGDGAFDRPARWLKASFGDGDDPQRHATTRFGDVDGDGRADVCVNGVNGVSCALSAGDHFAAPSVWTDGFVHDEGSAATDGFELVDIDSVPGLDICGVQDGEAHCAVSRGVRFDDAEVSVAAGAAAVRFGDIDGDGHADICLFDSDGARCSTARSGFAAPVHWDDRAVDPEILDGESALTLVDIDGDGRADRCDTRAALECALADSGRFRPAAPALAFAAGTTPDDELAVATMAVGARVQPGAVRTNRVVLENRRPGTEGWWVPYPQWSVDHEVEAYTDQLSYAPGDTVRVMLSTAKDGDSVTWMLLRTGWYGGRGARRILDGSVVGRPQPLPAAVNPHQPARAGWSPTFALKLPADAVSGVYALRLTSTATGKSSFVTLVVRRERRGADLVFNRADLTDEAYNDWDGGKNQSSAYHGAFYVSFDRPLRSVAALGIYSYSSGYFVYEYPMVRWLERQGYDVAYVSDLDVHRQVDLTHARVFLSVGHNEYWSAAMRDHVEHARDGGLNLAFFGSDAVDGLIRFARGDDRSFSTTISDGAWIKNESANKPLDLKHPPHANPSDSLTGTHYVNWCKAHHPECGIDPTAKLRIADDFVIGAPDHPIFRNVDTSLPLRQVVGYEYEAPYAHPELLPFRLQQLAVTSGLRLPEQASMLAYRAPSGALVVNVGSMHWAHALDDWVGRAAIRNSGGERACAPGENDCFERHDLAAAQITANMLSDLGVAPATPSSAVKPTTARLWP
jgi:hypothetical protein